MEISCKDRQFEGDKNKSLCLKFLSDLKDKDDPMNAKDSFFFHDKFKVCAT